MAERREQIARAACEWDDKDKGQCRCANAHPKINEYWCPSVVGVADAILALPSPALGEEREACAQVAADAWRTWPNGMIHGDDAKLACKKIAEAIRARSTPSPGGSE